MDTRDTKTVFIPEWIHRFKLDVKKLRREEIKCQKPIHVKAPIPTDYPSECFFDSIESNPHNVSQPHNDSSERMYPPMEPVAVSPRNLMKQLAKESNETICNALKESDEIIQSLV
ncbi:hypothetical protein TNCV_1659631 [Trichonephila clavipes]|nr:hypothetical protein TNCV_1659631 [Trichonephila clavipes]